MAADSGQALDVARVSVQQVETVIPATKNIIRRKKIQKSCLSGLHSSENPLFHECIPLAEPSEQGGVQSCPPQILSVIEDQNLKTFYFCLPPLPIFWSSYGPVCPYYFWKLLYMYIRAGGTIIFNYVQLPPKPLQILTDLDAKPVQLYDFLLIPPDLQTFRRACTCS